MILTEQEVDALRKSLPAVCKHQDVIRAAESAVLEKLKAQDHDKTKIECVTGAIYKHISGELYPREVIAAAQYIVHRYCTTPDDVVRDAERYKWLRKVAPNMYWDNHDKEIGFVRFDTKAYLWKPEMFDAAIDKAIGESE